MIVSFTDFVPPVRHDGLPWTQLTVEEGPAEVGPWTLLLTVNLAPLDANPTNPAARSFTVNNAVLTEGWYRVTFKDAAGNLVRVDPVHNITPSDIDYRPSLSQVARKNMARSRDQYGNMLGTFTPATQVTDTQVVAVTTDVLTELSDVIGDSVPDKLMDDAANVAAIKVAMQIELNFFADQVNTGRSIYPQLEKQYDAALKALQRQITLFQEGSATVGEAAPSNVPRYSFPTAIPWLTKRM